MHRLRVIVLSTVLVVAVTAPVAAAPDDGPDNRGPDQQGPVDALQAFHAQVSPEVVQDLREAGVDIAAQQATDGDLVDIEVIATQDQLAAFDEGADFEPTSGQEEVNAAGTRRGARALGDGVFRPWDGPDGIEAELLAIAAEHPDMVKLVDIGDTVEGRDIWALKVTRSANVRRDGTRPAVLYSSNQHAREWITVEMTRRLLHHYLDNYDSDRDIRRLVNGNELWFVVSANPDGYQRTHDDPANRLWRKNVADNDGDGKVTNADGVDLNRNFAYKWGYDNEGSSPSPTSATYRGTAPNSEPETQAMDQLLTDIGFEWQVNYHSAAELLLYGMGWQVSTETPDDIVYEAIAGDDAEPAVPGYDPDVSAELYTTNGETTNHAHEVYGTLAFTPEMSTCQTASRIDPDDEWEPGDCQSVFNFPDDEALIQAEFENNIPFALDVAKSAKDPANPVSHLGNETPGMVVEEFPVAHGTSQQVQVVADRDLGPVTMYWSVIQGGDIGHPGKISQTKTQEWSGGQRYGGEFDVYYHYVRGTVKNANPGDRVTVWFQAGTERTEPFSYTVAHDIGGDVLVVADTDYGNLASGGVNDLRYLDYYGDAIEANGHTWDLYDVAAHDAAPDPLGVLSHYDTVVWYTGDNLATDYDGSSSIRLANDMNVALRDGMNQGAALLATGKNVGLQEDFGLPYGENGDPDSRCTSTCLFLSNDFFQYWLGGFDHSRRGGLGPDDEALDVDGFDTPYDGLAWTLDGGDSAMNQGSVGGTNTTGTGTGSWVVTSDVLPPDEFPVFTSNGSAEWQGGSNAFEPLTGDHYMASQAADISFKRLSRSVDLTAATSGSIEAAVSHDTEADWDFVFVEAHTVGQDDWTTLPIDGVTTPDTGASCTSGWQSQLHGFLEHYQTLRADGTCSPSGTTGDWNAVSGTSDGWENWSIDLSDYAGSEVEVAISYVSDWGTQSTGVFVDDTSVVIDGTTVTETSFEDDLGGWSVPGSPKGSAANANDWIRSEALVLAVATVTTDASVLQGFGFEGISTEDERTTVMGRTLDHLMGITPPPPPDPGELAAEVVSSRADSVSGGDLRLSVNVPEPLPLDQVQVAVDGESVDVELAAIGDERRVEGVVTGLPLGTATITVTGAGDNPPVAATVEVVNHPNAGPMFSGPHQQPFYCQTEAAGLGPALDDDCFAETVVEFRYASDQGGFKPLPDGDRPADMRTTTSTNGETVDYVVRLETGVINRAVYQTAVLYDPEVVDTDAPEATPGWNGRLVYSYGGGCNAAYAQGAGNGGVLTDLHLSQGYATASSSLNVLNNNCNDVLSAETTSMVKEHLIETYGQDVHTIGWGGSGGAISQYLIAHNYPGLLDGIIPTLDFPDATSIFSGIGDCRLTYQYFEAAPAGLWDDASQSAVAGFHDWTNCLAWEFSFANRIDATTGCNPIVPPDTIFDPDTNPDGVRCSVADDSVNVLGLDPNTGAAPTPADNLGVQYGLAALNAGDVSVEQFLDLNTTVGGFDGNGEVVDGRTGPSSAIDRFYETGRIITGQGLATTPIINLRPYLDDVSDIHTRWYTFNVRERLLRDNGSADNQVVQIYGRDTPAAVQGQAIAAALADMDEWIGVIGTDPQERTSAQVIAAKPDRTRDTCWDADGSAIVEPASYDGDTTCNDLYPSFGDPRTVAGAPLAGDVLSCQRVAPVRSNYEVTFTADEWAQLLAAFPEGVCDWSQPGTGQGTWTGPWQSFGG